MANRVIKDTVWKSKSLAKLKPYLQDQWVRCLLMADDWGCFDADSEIIKGLAYPKRKETSKDIKRIIQNFKVIGLLVLWNDEDREWGFCINSDKHQVVRAMQFNNVGERVKHRRKTPRPCAGTSPAPAAPPAARPNPAEGAAAPAEPGSPIAPCTGRRRYGTRRESRWTHNCGRSRC